MAISTGKIEICYDDGSTTEIELPFITAIEMDMSVSLTEMDTIIYGYENKFIIDLGTVQRYTLSLERVNPFPYDDSDTASPTQWSNGKWYRYLESALNRWQTLFKNPDNPNELLGAFKLQIDSGDTELYPNVIKYVVMSGTLSISRSDVQRLSLSLPLTVAKLPGTSGVANTITVYFSPGSGAGSVFAQEYNSGFAGTLPGPPSSWDPPESSQFFGWLSPEGVEYSSGDSVTWTSSNDGETWTAIWRQPMEVEIFRTAGDYSCPVPDNASYAVVYVVGAGGGAGASVNSVGPGMLYYTSGGAGGSGGVTIRNIEIYSTGSARSLSVTVGKGGTSPNYGLNSGDAGGRGGESSVSYGGTVRARAYGGYGGSAANVFSASTAGGKGGSGAPAYTTSSSVSGDKPGYSGGSAGATWDVSGESGSKGESGTAGTGHASQSFDAPFFGANPISSQGGAGGGASDFDYTFDGESFISKGGDGGLRRHENDGGNIAPSTPQYGGGAGSATSESGPNGADGLVVVVFY